MKQILFILLLFVPSLVYPSDKKFDLFTLENYGYIVMSLDWLQTRQIVKHPKKYKETNKVLGAHPSMRKINFFLGGFMISHYFVNKYSPKYIKDTWNITMSIGKTYAVVHNYSIGIRINKKF